MEQSLAHRVQKGEAVEGPGQSPAAHRSLFGRAVQRAGGVLLKGTHEFRDLFLSHDHPAAAARERSGLIARRIRLIAGILAVLTLAWIPVDTVTVPAPYWQQIMIGRFVAAFVFLVFALRRAHWPRANPAIEVSILVAVPLAFFVYTCDLLNISGYHGALAVSTAYFYLPFIVAAGLSMFPLTALEVAVPALLTIGAMTLAVDVWPQFLGGQSGLATVWRIILTAGIAGLAGMSQLRFLLRLTGEATRDGLTGLLTRRVGDEMLDIQFAYAKRHDLPFTVLFVDLDHFKSINDKFGHKAGDAVLCAVGQALSKMFRRQDITIRWGGEEFVVGLPGTDGANAELIVRRLAATGVGRRPDGSAVTASIGIAERQADGADKLRTLTDLADQRMYEAKQAGRDRYTFRNGPRHYLEPVA